jgi:hypothetical protein
MRTRDCTQPPQVAGTGCSRAGLTWENQAAQELAALDSLPGITEAGTATKKNWRGACPATAECGLARWPASVLVSPEPTISTFVTPMTMPEGSRISASRCQGRSRWNSSTRPRWYSTSASSCVTPERTALWK